VHLILWTSFGLLAAAGTAWAGATIVDVTVPELTPEAEAGQAAFGEHCSACHGPTAGGTGKGPPLVHPLYVESHHGDAAFFLAARQGARAHHWDFGDMDPVPGVTDEELEAIVVYVRELQRANGLP
jgi:mono/diheme cytochrome c family protein